MPTYKLVGLIRTLITYDLFIFEGIGGIAINNKMESKVYCH
jgi:hypothetical protein